MSSDRLIAARREYWLAWAEEHGAATSADLEARVFAALSQGSSPIPRRHYVREVAEAFGMTTSTVTQRCHAGWPHRRDNRRIYFLDEDLAAIGQADRVPPRDMKPQRRPNTRGPHTYDHL